jgi:hypothetical protein
MLVPVRSDAVVHLTHWTTRIRIAQPADSMLRAGLFLFPGSLIAGPTSDPTELETTCMR